MQAIFVSSSSPTETRNKLMVIRKVAHKVCVLLHHVFEFGGIHVPKYFASRLCRYKNILQTIDRNMSKCLPNMFWN